LDLAGRFGVAPMVGAALVPAVAGAPVLLRGQSLHFPRARLGWLLAGFGWIVISIVLLIDWPVGSGLFYDVTAVDYVKHAETTWSIAQSATPPWNPTFFTPGAKASYYYFYYNLTAVVDVVAGTLFGAAARHAAYAGGSVVFLALPALMHELWKRSGVDEAVGARSSNRSARLWIALLLLTAGLDLIEIAKNYLNLGHIPESPASWAEEMTPWVLSALWVPQHVVALIAAFVGFMALARPAPFDLRRTVLAALAFASTAGLSVYIALAAALAAAMWLIVLLARRRAGDAANLAGAGLGAVAFAAPWLMTLAGRMADKPPIAFAFRNHDVLPLRFHSLATEIPARLGVMLAIYVVQFGIFAFGAYVFWRKAGRKGYESDMGLILVLSTIASFVLGSFFYSTIINNDLGWRVMLFAQAGTLVWTLAAIRAGELLKPAGRVSLAVLPLAMGYGYVLFMMQYNRFSWIGTENARALDADARAAWTWLDRRLPVGALVQAQPDVERSIDFGLYGRFPTPVADLHVGQLFGASESAVQARIDEMEPIFSDRDLSLEKARALAARRDLAAIVVTSNDPAFNAPRAWTAQIQPAFSTPHARVYLMKGTPLAAR
ncbi:hypothetical protein, partial [Rhodoblastus sp.]|uniref:hypothetical protein n=1 Tax=Rhodoblastus sp. TaxID=1962975 RepID=UPI003F99F805